MFCSFLFFFSSFVPRGSRSSSKSCTRILFRKIRTLPDFCCYLIIVVVLFRQNYYPQIVDWFPTSRECVCMEFVCWLVGCWWLSIRVFMTRFQVRIFMTSSTSRIRSVFYEVFLLFAYTIFFNSPPLICCILLYLSKEFLLIY